MTKGPEEVCSLHNVDTVANDLKIHHAKITNSEGILGIFCITPFHRAKCFLS